MTRTVRPLYRPLLIALGLLSIALGIVGIFVPLLPTTPFVLLSAWCFMRSSDRFYLWLTQHPRFGPMHRAWVEKGAIARPAKKMAVVLIFTSLVTIWIWVDPLAVRVGVSVLLGCVTAFIVTRPSTEN